MTSTKDSATPVYRMPLSAWVLLALALALAVVTFHAGLAKMVEVWLTSEEYSHGSLIPLISGFLIWQKKHELEQLEFRGHWAGVFVVLIGGVLHALGELATLYVLQQYAVLVVLYGMVLALTGWAVFKRLWAPLLILIFTVPLPEFLLRNFSAQLQLISSQIGVAVMRLFNVSVYLQGNVIDLGSYRLQVAEACSGLRYLFPLMTLGFVMACLYQAPLWKRVVLFVSSVPVTIVMNSLRIGMIGVLVEHFGPAMAEGFLHDFEGWLVFMLSAGVLLLEVILMTRLSREQRSWRELFGIEWPAPTPAHAIKKPRPLEKPVIAALCALIVIAGAAWLLPQRAEASMQRRPFVEFPLAVGDWQGRREALDPIYIDALKFDDYLNADYVRAGSAPVNLYIAYYASQRRGQSVHSPRSCIPGGGWQIVSLTQRELAAGGRPLLVNRVVTEFGTHKQIVYYWFQQRGRIVTNEYQVKLFIFWDALTRNRTDGGLVRLSIPLSAAMDEAAADARLTEFAGRMLPALPDYIPE